MAVGKKGTLKVQKTIKKERKSPKDVKNFDCDEDTRYTGTCCYYNTSSGYGFIKPDADSGIPVSEVMIYWKNIESEDRWPFLYKGLKVEFSVEKYKKGRNTELRCTKVTGEGGDKLSIQEENEEKFDYVGDRNMRFLGNVKWYDFKKGFGYVKLQDGYEIDGSVPTELRVVRQQINSGTDAPNLKDGMEVEFGIQVKDAKFHQCYRVTLPGGDEITRELLDGRELSDETTYEGTISWWNWQDGYGWIDPPTASLPAAIQTSLKEDLEKRTAKAKKAGKEAPSMGIYFRRADRANFDQKISKGCKVNFQIYKDSQGVGACNVSII